jgi:hypothetical protein
MPTNQINQVNSCQAGQKTVTIPTKVLFLVDQSGSNITGGNEVTTGVTMAPTDPNKTFRTGAMMSFFGEHAADASVAWDLAVFMGTQATPLMPSGDNGFGPSADFIKALTNFGASPDGGATPYGAALTYAQNLISQDMLTSPPDEHYLIAFLTDGYPTDFCPGGPTDYLCPGQINNAAINQAVKDVVSQGGNRVQFSTVYYGPVDPDATNRLSAMASVGGGQFVDMNDHANLNLNDIMTVPVDCQ